MSTAQLTNEFTLRLPNPETFPAQKRRTPAESARLALLLTTARISDRPKQRIISCRALFPSHFFSDIDDDAASVLYPSDGSRHIELDDAFRIQAFFAASQFLVHRLQEHTSLKRIIPPNTSMDVIRSGAAYTKCNRDLVCVILPAIDKELSILDNNLNLLLAETGRPDSLLRTAAQQVIQDFGVDFVHYATWLTIQNDGSRPNCYEPHIMRAQAALRLACASAGMV